MFSTMLQFLLIKYFTVYTCDCSTNCKVAGSIPDGVSGFFHWHNPVGRTVALGVDSRL
jgi:hypothetical protein